MFTHILSTFPLLFAELPISPRREICWTPLYSCVAENEAGAAERHFDVDVVARTVGRPPIVRHGDPGSHDATEGDNVTLRLGVDFSHLESSLG